MNRSLLTLLLIFLLSACTKNDFKVQFELSDKVSGSYRMVYFAETKKQEKVFESTAIVVNGKCNLLIPVGKQSIAYLFTSSSQTPAIVIYIERGDEIKITGESADPFEWEVGGNKVNEELSAWRRANLKALRSGNAKEINKAVESAVGKAPGKVSSAILMLTAFNRSENPALYVKLWNSLEKKARNAAVIEAIGRFDQLTPEDASPDKPMIKKLDIYVKGDSMVTLKSADVKGTLYYFWDERNEWEIRETLDSLAKIYKEMPDSAKFRIVDISLIPDSTSWSYRTRNDSITLSRRGWVPTGRMNPDIIDFRLPKIPMIVVIDDKGKQCYTGTDLDKARKELRKQATRKEKKAVKKKKTASAKKNTVKPATAKKNTEKKKADAPDKSAKAKNSDSKPSSSTSKRP